MLRWWLRPIAACVLAVGSVPASSADSSINNNVTQLGGRSMSARLRLNAALALSNTKTKDPRAVIALARALTQDSDERVRRVAALGLEKMVDASTAEDAKQLAFAALEEASSIDKDATVREIATRAIRSFASLRKKPTAKARPRNGKPEVFVNIDRTNDQSKKLPSDAGERVAKIVKKSVESTGYSTTWPTGSLPTIAELNSSRSRAFIVASTVKKIEITKTGGQTTVACTVAMRIAPWTGRDGGERWEANRAAQASGSAKAVTGNRDRDVQGGVRDCVEAVAEDVTSRQVVPFLKRVAQM